MPQLLQICVLAQEQIKIFNWRKKMRKVLSFILSVFLILNTVPAMALSTIATTTYDGFGDSLVKIANNKLFYAYNIRTQHGAGAGSYIAGRIYTCTDHDCEDGTGSWGEPFTIWQQSGKDVDVANILIVPSGKIFVFFNIVTSSTGDADSLGYVTSTDNTATWSSYTAVFTPPSVSGIITAGGKFLTTGAPVATNRPGEYMLWMHGKNDAGSLWENRLIRTLNYGDTWDTSIVVASGSTSNGEGSLINLGNNKMVALVRLNIGGPAGLFRSTDSGQTWGARITTNIGTGGIIVPNMYDDPQNDNVIITVMDRQSSGAQKYVIVSRNKLQYYTNDFPAFTTLDSGYTANGYTGVCRMSDTKVMIIWSKEISASVAELTYEIITTGNPNQHLLFE